MATVLEVAERFRAELLAADREAARQLIAAYRPVYQDLQRQLRTVTAMIAEARKAGQSVSPAWLYRQDRYKVLLAQVERQISIYAANTGQTVSAQQRQAGNAGIAAASAELEAAGVAAVFTALPSSAVEQIVGALQRDSPLSRLLASMGADAAAGVRQALVTAVATGMGPRETARLIRKAFSVPLNRALTIARTEQLRAFRESSRASYQVHDDVVEGWVWISARDRRSCAFCLAQHGSIHKLSEPLASHVSCRCSMAPLTRENPIKVTPGPEWFAEQDAAFQRNTLGPAKFRAYQDGAIDLEDVRGFRHDRDWGPVGYERSLASILGVQDARRYSRAA